MRLFGHSGTKHGSWGLVVGMQGVGCGVRMRGQDAGSGCGRDAGEMRGQNYTIDLGAGDAGSKPLGDDLDFLLNLNLKLAFNLDFYGIRTIF